MDSDPVPTNARTTLRREFGVTGAVFMGLGAMMGTGVFVSIGIAAGIAGPAVILAIAVAAIVATCNALSSAQLAAAQPVSGGTYEYGHRLLSPALGFTAGWMFLCAKTASAATAALGFAGYASLALSDTAQAPSTPIALGAVTALTIVVMLGVRRAAWVNTVIVSITLLSLLTFVVAGWPQAVAGSVANLTPFWSPEVDATRSSLPSFLEATALMFVAFTGYGRIATMGEEIRRPRRTIPFAIIVTVLVTAAVYLAVACVAVASAGARSLADATMRHAAPLEIIAEQFDRFGGATHRIVALGAITAMLGVLLNLILGLSRVLLAMGRRGDVPPALAKLNTSHTTPYVAVIVVGIAIASLSLIGDVKTTWSFSAFTVLVYYAITNAAVLRLPRDQRLYPRAIAWAGLLACLALAFWVEWRVWMIGLALIAASLAWRAGAQRRWRRSAKHA